MEQPLFGTSYAPRGGESTLDEIEIQLLRGTSAVPAEVQSETLIPPWEVCQLSDEGMRL